MQKTVRFSGLAVAGLVVVSIALAQQQPNDSPGPQIPKRWDDEALASLEVPLAEPAAYPV